MKRPDDKQWGPKQRSGYSNTLNEYIDHLEANESKIHSLLDQVQETLSKVRDTLKTRDL